MFSLAALVLLSAIPIAPVSADGRSDWQGYDWRSSDFGICLEGSVDEGCLAHHAKWDWKRNQWVDIRYARMPGGDLLVTQHLVNNDRNDDDYVCVTVLFLDDQGRNVAAYHTNLRSHHESAKDDTETLQLTPTQLAAITQVEVGSKQCRNGATQDADTYASVLEALH